MKMSVDELTPRKLIKTVDELALDELAVEEMAVEGLTPHLHQYLEYSAETTFRFSAIGYNAPRSNQSFNLLLVFGCCVSYQEPMLYNFCGRKLRLLIIS
jgi:hypothetical protein